MSQDFAQTDFTTQPPEELGEFRVASSAEIAAILRQLQESQTLITLISEGDAPLVSRICELDLANGKLGLELPTGSASYVCKGLEMTAEAFLNDIRVQFELAPPQKLGSGIDAMLSASLPAIIYRFQRRRAFRVKPHSRAPQAAVVPAEGGSVQRLRVLDVSMGGIALLMPPGNPIWATGQLLEAEVELDRHTHFKASLRIQHTMQSDESLGTPFGCAFTNLAPMAQRLLQLYIDQTQKLNRLVKKA
ncbi:MAG: flagellar brake protein [Paucibacter sp.]|nr:flagellar brake protein [Roseateles sp.]